MYLRKQTLIFIAGAVWLIVGSALLAKGVTLILSVGVLKTLLLYTFAGLVLGVLKGRFAFFRSAMRTINRLVAMEGPIRLTQLYRIQDMLLIAAMVALGRLLHLVHCPSSIHGFIDVAVGVGLIFGSVVYFRFALSRTVT
ncbi:MAG: hypothetical protein K940chlam2_01235 [Chlamydiae bacterium]|nr:hypothetical protein [Chlamydiota bacterium]